ncbi:MFS transporter, partial [Francisella orientalis]|uniref:MFS transporter n=1 Tax=Francisella orientalis TaxID=299583 RepID=UPI0030CA3B17
MLSPLTNNIYITHIANSLILIVNFGVTILTIFYIDKWGRKKVIFTGLTITLISMILLIVLYSLPTFD